MRNAFTLLLALLLMPTTHYTAQATGIYLSEAEFIQQAFAGGEPQRHRLWIGEELKAAMHTLLGHEPRVLRVRYWGSGQRTAWILEEIGKDKPITTGVVVNAGRIERIEVLVFRESRGWEIRYPFFTGQFKNAALQDDGNLDVHIDGISGATLSVMAMQKIAKLALLFHAYSDYGSNR